MVAILEIKTITNTLYKLITFKKKVSIIVTLSLLFSCKPVGKTEVENNSETNAKHTQTELIKPEDNQIEWIVQQILNLTKLQWIFHPELKEKLPVKLMETALIKKNFTLYKFKHKVRILSPSEIEKEGIKDFVFIDIIKIKSKMIDFKLHYKIEGISCSGTFLKERGTWKITAYSVFEN
ncbi:hypothetical protein [Olleya sp. HaHaR_3_96]|uniref:hypothetical protein n=1 Tax=Olleya sp. HaHaR_3_96 TaxID=2745560 RepID=UPI001C502136|nr:hypothetical protein [Olleya sp. HaHaR_3_96]QXP60842.1 hypothetical protein H0I26_04175 [Olleya sp. HaHaR_3_96]